jgi:hypothetical protein
LCLFRPSNSKKDKERKDIVTSTTGHDRKGRGSACRLRKTKGGAWRIEVLSFQGTWVLLPFKIVFQEPDLKAAVAEAVGFLDGLERDAGVPAMGSTEELPELRYFRIANSKPSPEKPQRKRPSAAADKVSKSSKERASAASTSKKAESPAVRTPIASSSSKTPAQEPATRNLTAVDMNKVAQMLGKPPRDETLQPDGTRRWTSAAPIAFTPMRNAALARPPGAADKVASGSSTSSLRRL